MRHVPGGNQALVGGRRSTPALSSMRCAPRNAGWATVQKRRLDTANRCPCQDLPERIAPAWVVLWPFNLEHAPELIDPLSSSINLLRAAHLSRQSPWHRTSVSGLDPDIDSLDVSGGRKPLADRRVPSRCWT